MRIKSLNPIFFLLTSFLLVAFTPPNKRDNPTDPFIVVLDAGHGGHDPGNLGNGYLEKNIALNIVLNVGKILSANKDIKVIYTRNDDTFIDLYVRGEIANKANADLFVSVHCDSHTSDAHGAGTFVLGLHANKQNFEIAKKENSVIYLEDNYETRYADYDINSPESVIGLTIMQEEFLDQSIALAKGIQDNFSNKLKRTNRKVKQAGFIVLHQTFMPSVLVETGFLTNKEEGAYLNSKKGQSEIGTAIAQAILKYKAEHTIASQGATEQTQAKQPKVLGDAPLDKTTVENTTASKSVDKEIKATEEVGKEVVTTVIKPKEKEPIKQEEAKPNPTQVVKSKSEEKSAQITFKVQLMASSKDVPLKPSNFKGLTTITKEPYKNLYRYLYGETPSYKEAKMLQSKASSSGYTTAYIVAYKEGIRIPVAEALKEASE